MPKTPYRFSELAWIGVGGEFAVWIGLPGVFKPKRKSADRPVKNVMVEKLLIWPGWYDAMTTRRNAAGLIQVRRA